MPRAIFPTPLGDCAIAWSDAGFTGFELPGATPRHGDVSAPPSGIATLVARVRRHLGGEPQDFSGERYAFAAVPEFNRRVLRAALDVKSGHTATYGEIATAIGEPTTASRGVGAALGANRWPLLIRCYRITGADGRMTGFSGPGGVATKAKILALEGACLL